MIVHWHYGSKKIITAASALFPEPAFERNDFSGECAISLTKLKPVALKTKAAAPDLTVTD